MLSLNFCGPNALFVLFSPQQMMDYGTRSTMIIKCLGYGIRSNTYATLLLASYVFLGKLPALYKSCLVRQKIAIPISSNVET